jgi:hypothetical protein
MKRRHGAIGFSYRDHVPESDDARPESRPDRRNGMKSLFMPGQQAPGAMPETHARGIVRAGKIEIPCELAGARTLRAPDGSGANAAPQEAASVERRCKTPQRCSVTLRRDHASRA